MRNWKRFMGALAVAGVVLGPSPGVRAQVRDVRPDALVDSPERFAEACIEKAEHVGATCERSIAKTAKRCVRAVRRLVEAGRLDRAARVAATCEARITEKARRCSHEIEGHCARCVDRLTEIGAVHLAERVRGACAEVLAGIADLVARALDAIADALAGGTGGFDGATRAALP